MNIETVNEISKNLNCATSLLHTLILAYGFNISPMKQSAKDLLPGYSNQIADTLYVINQNLVGAQNILKEALKNE